MNEAGRKVWSLTRSHLSRIKDVEKLRRVAAGDLKPIDEVKDVQERERLGSETRATQRRKEEQERRDHARKAATEHLKPRYEDPADFIESPSSNGKRPNF